MTWMRPRERNGTRYLGMSPRGGIAEPPSPHYSETGAGCQCVRWLCGPTRKTWSSVSRNFYSCLIPTMSQRYLNDQHDPRRQKNYQHDLAECGLVEAAEQF